jgi:tRNA(Ile)-lysidine synthase
MADKVELAFRRAALRLIPEGTPLLVAVSGGGDSVALLHLLLRFAAQRKNELTLGHLDHGLRRGARADRRFVEGLGRRLGLPCIAERHEMSELKMKRESPEEASRRVRRAFLLGAAKQVGAELIVTGHTLDDQAETILMRLVRGAGATALTGMAASGPGPFVRPLLEIEREELRGYLKRRDLAFREDPSNRDLRFDRNRVRRVALPLLAETLNPRASRHLVKAARMLREDALYLDAEALGTCRRRSPPLGRATRRRRSRPGQAAGDEGTAPSRRPGPPPWRARHGPPNVTSGSAAKGWMWLNSDTVSPSGRRPAGRNDNGSPPERYIY